MIYDKVMLWQKPVKEGVTEVKASLTIANSRLLTAKLSDQEMAQVQLMINQAQAIIKSVQKDGSWGVHAPDYTLQKVREAKVLADGAKATLLAGKKQLAKK